MRSPERGVSPTEAGTAAQIRKARSRRSNRLLALVGLLLFVPGCVSIGGRGDYNPFRSSDARRISIVIENRNSRAVDVEALAAGRRIYLARVPGGGRAGVTIPWSETQDLGFQIDPVTSSGHRTASIRVTPGEDIELWVQDPIQLSVIRQ